MAGKTLAIKIVTPARVVYSKEADMVVAPATLGYLGILADHAPLVTSLDIGIMKVKSGKEEETLAVSGGFLEVKNNQVVVLAEAAEKATEIDRDRAEEARKRAEKRLADKAAETDMIRAELALKRALNRIKVMSK